MWSYVVNSRFGNIEEGFMVKSLQETLSTDIRRHSAKYADIRVKRVATSMKQSTEWSMRDFETPFLAVKIV